MKEIDISKSLVFIIKEYAMGSDPVKIEAEEKKAKKTESVMELVASL